MTRLRRNTVKVTRADGTSYEMPTYDRTSMRLILNSTNLTDYDRAMISIACPICDARPGRNCRAPKGHITRHRERIDAYRTRRSQNGRPESDRLKS